MNGQISKQNWKLEVVLARAKVAAGPSDYQKVVFVHLALRLAPMATESTTMMHCNHQTIQDLGIGLSGIHALVLELLCHCYWADEKGDGASPSSESLSSENGLAKRLIVQSRSESDSLSSMG